MPTLARIVVVVLLLAVVAFCAVGFLATFEPLDRKTQLAWRIGYGVASVLGVAALVRLARPRRLGS